MRGLPKHLLDDIEEDDVIEYLAVALTWLVVSTAFCILVGKCIASGLAGGGTRDGLAGPGEGVGVPPQRTSVSGDELGSQLPSVLRS